MQIIGEPIVLALFSISWFSIWALRHTLPLPSGKTSAAITGSSFRILINLLIIIDTCKKKKSTFLGWILIPSLNFIYVFFHCSQLVFCGLLLCALPIPCVHLVKPYAIWNHAYWFSYVSMVGKSFSLYILYKCGTNF